MPSLVVTEHPVTRRLTRGGKEEIGRNVRQRVGLVGRDVDEL